MLYVLALNVRTCCMLYVLALNERTYCMLYLLVLNVRTYCMLYVLALRNSVERCAFSYPSYLRVYGEWVNLEIVSAWHSVL